MIEHVESFIVDSEIGYTPDKIGFIECINLSINVDSDKFLLNNCWTDKFLVRVESIFKLNKK